MNVPPTSGSKNGAGKLAAYRGARIAVTGGLGFIGSTLTRRLLALGAEVLIVDHALAGSGANPFNLEGCSGLEQSDCDIRDTERLRPLLAGRDFLFNLAAQTSHAGSMSEPLLDLDINCRAQLALLEACRAVAPAIRIVFASTRQIYGKPRYLPVDEQHPIQPPDVNGIDKAAAENFHLLYHQVYGLRSTALRLTNVYGPRMRVKDARQTFVGVWLRRVLEGERFDVWGGQQKRDLSFIDDTVEAFLLAAVTPSLYGRAANIGGDRAVTLRHLADLIIAANGGGDYDIREFPPERLRIDIGDYWSDDSFFRGETGWTPRVPLAEGIARSLAFFREHLAHYL